MEQNSASNPLTGLHKQRLYALIIAAIGVISCILPWWKISYGGYGVGVSINGLHDLGWVTFLGFIAAGVLTFIRGDKSRAFEGQDKMLVAASFAVAGGIALIQFLRQTKFATFGIFLAILAGVIGALFVWGIVKMPADKKPPL